MATRRSTRIALLGGAAGLAALAPATVAEPAEATGEGPFSAAVEQDAETGWKVIVLRFRDPRRAADALEARIAPEAGANLYSLKLGDDEILVQPAKLADLKQNRTGTPVLYPTPNRVRDAAMEFEGRRFAFEANNGKNFIHGLVRNRPFAADPPTATRRGASARLWLAWDESQPDFARFPIRHRLEISFALGRDGIRIAFRVHNRGDARLPFGFGLHPWFRVPGERRDVTLELPAAERMEAVDKLPTGKLLPVAGTPFDLRHPVSLEGLDLDDVYIGLRPSAQPAFAWRDRGLRVTLAGSSEFTHMVVYTPPGKPFFCMENQTSSTDAHNLHGRGLRREAHLLVVDKGRAAGGFVDWRLRRLPAAGGKR